MNLLRSLAALAWVAAATSARAESPADAGRRLAASLLRQAAAQADQSPVRAVAVAPPRSDAPAQVRETLDAVAAGLREGGVELRDWKAFDAALATRVRDGALQGALELPALPEVQAVLVGQGTYTADGEVRFVVRLVLVPTGAALAADAATVELRPERGAAPAEAAGAPVTSSSIEVAIRRLSDALAAGFYKLPGARYRRLAVLDFTEAGAEARARELGKVVAAELAVDLRRDHDLFLVERSRVGAVLSELRLAEMGAVDAAAATRLGKLADAQGLVIGAVSEAGDRYLVTARVVATETGETLAVASESISAASLVALSSGAVVLRSRRDALFRSLVAPGWGQLYNRQPAKGAAVAGAEAALLAGALAFHLRGASAEDDYRRRTTAGELGSDPAAAAAALRRKAEQSYRTRNTLLWISAGVWALNVADAWFSGVDGEKLLGAVPLEDGAGMVLSGRF